MSYNRPDKAIRENIIVKMEEDRDAVQAAFADLFRYDHIEHDVDFTDHAAPAVEMRSRVAICDLAPAGGGCSAAVVPGPGATIDVKVGLVSLLVAPAPLVPGITPLFFNPNVVVPAGSKIDYIYNDGAVVGIVGVCCNVQWIKDLDNQWVPEPPL